MILISLIDIYTNNVDRRFLASTCNSVDSSRLKLVATLDRSMSLVEAPVMTNLLERS